MSNDLVHAMPWQCMLTHSMCILRYLRFIYCRYSLLNRVLEYHWGRKRVLWRWHLEVVLSVLPDHLAEAVEKEGGLPALFQVLQELFWALPDLANMSACYPNVTKNRQIVISSNNYKKSSGWKPTHLTSMGIFLLPPDGTMLMAFADVNTDVRRENTDVRWVGFLPP
jgi:hypothetical protein